MVNTRMMKRRSAEPFLHCNHEMKEVCFASVQVREYPVVLGDNPSCTSGPPITLAWDHDADAIISCTIDEWENERRDYRRSRQEIHVPASVRREWLLDAGYSASQLQESVETLQKERQLRRSSFDKSSLQDKADIVAERMKRKLERAIGKRGRSSNLYEKWMVPNNARVHTDDCQLKSNTC